MFLYQAVISPTSRSLDLTSDYLDRPSSKF